MDQIKTTSDMMAQLQEEIEAVKSGTLEESKARVVSRFRALQLKTAELQLSYARLVKGRTPEPYLPLLTPASEGKKSST